MKDISGKPFSDYLFDLAERLFQIPVMYGVNGYDYDQLRFLANKLQKLEQKTVKSK